MIALDDPVVDHNSEYAHDDDIVDADGNVVGVVESGDLDFARLPREENPEQEEKSLVSVESDQPLALMVRGTLFDHGFVGSGTVLRHLQKIIIVLR